MKVRCPECKEVFDWLPSHETGAVAGAWSIAGATPDDTPEEYTPEPVYFYICPNKKCRAPLQISSRDKKRATIETIIDAVPSTNPQIDEFWAKYGQELVNDTLKKLDDRAKTMITTCASLIVINFGLLLAFEGEPVSINLTPQFFFAISAVFFVVSYFPIGRRFHLDAPRSIEASYDFWKKWKLAWHLLGFAFFIMGLFAIAVTGLIGQPV